MIRELLLKTFIPVSRIFDNEDDIFIFSKNVRNSKSPNASRESSRCKRKINKNKRIENNMKYQMYTIAFDNCRL